MSSLTELKLVIAKKPTQLSPVIQRRNKLIKRLWEQIQLAKAQQSGSVFAPAKMRSYTDSETGLRKQIEVPKRIKPWHFTADNGKLCVQVRYGSAVLELAKGKSAVELANADQLIPTLEAIKAAVSAGEIDAQIEAAAMKLKSGFTK